VGAVLFSNGGSDAVEGALKIARQYHKLRGQADRTSSSACARATTACTSAA
jgi:adenosylmethionine-8-amino-7-oxononanoate aminotransferase